MWYSNLEYELASGEPWFPAVPVGLPRLLEVSGRGEHLRYPQGRSLPQAAAAPVEPVVCQVVIPPTYQRLPILSRLTSRFGVTVNIVGAVLSARRKRGGEFLLALGGKPQQQASSLAYLKDLQVQFVPKRDIKAAPRLLSEGDSSEQKPVVLPRGCDRVRLQIHIPAHCHPQPVISNLVKDHDVAVTILSASLPSQGEHDGWFELELWGLPTRLEAAVATLNQSDCALWLAQ
ncbi:NIL domain-containing protein [Nodosilinea sp. PGN35]|uniref:NIL domain-containing protein n=1 Tax=Nodosilinea sp. PGN35 TaxID=3020489 RepID=UPI0023B2C3D1|nr:NIL domain-containing protein [Nodosilinea sp. TSF1-S3]MDF0366311.1 NIL domain-containing protein [Nodosilinea sp. TSF1-S3]